ncbi:putative cold-shock DNA-binding protein [Stella humosa]|uniref:Putative cold-shock DNA-binding protein n=1 Tax=Stella humosa TaxID=94 RepID=A0A3N1LX39_9PROT|nr:cold shock domain-containing protein [Stella humosa]ROP99753.1 putative cold-shock DNA-binding protein [Stella humosa]BBK31020.1 cold-shock protein [Stella humosa]
MSNKPYGRGERTRRGFSDDNYYPAPRSPYPASSSSAPRFPASSSAPMGGPTVTVDASVKWFNPTKGFGFVTPVDGSGDAFLHVSVVEGAGLTEIAEGTTIRCEIGTGQKGRQVARILSVDQSTAAASPRPRAPMAPGAGAGGFAARPPRPDRDAPMGDPTEMEGTVKWYSVEKGFGFVAAPDGGKDIFIHSNTLKRSQIATLEPEQAVRMTVVPTQKGREATSVEIV